MRFGLRVLAARMRTTCTGIWPGAMQTNTAMADTLLESMLDSVPTDE
jgi:hypothetical protein